MLLSFLYKKKIVRTLSFPLQTGQYQKSKLWALPTCRCNGDIITFQVVTCKLQKILHPLTCLAWVANIVFVFVSEMCQNEQKGKLFHVANLVKRNHRSTEDKRHEEGNQNIVNSSQYSAENSL